MKKTKIYFTIAFIFIALMFIGTTKSEAASVLWPVGGDNASETYIEYGYGTRTYSSQDYIDKCKRDYNMDVTEGYYVNYENHFGVDIFGKPGETYSVVAVADGTVLGTSANYRDYNFAGINYANQNERRTWQGCVDGFGYGNFVAIQDDNTGKCYFYGHLKAGTICVEKGQKVKAGEQIGIMGSSGDSGHMHLHFEVRRKPENLLYTSWYDSRYLMVAYTTGYGVETENPVDYIGDKPPVEEKKKNKREIKGIASKEELTTYGDLNGDGIVTLQDAILILKLYVNRMGNLIDDCDYAVEYADVNNDGEVSLDDAQLTLKYVLSCSIMETDPNTTPIRDYVADLLSKNK